MSRAVLAIGVVLSLGAPASRACISASEADRRQEIGDDLALQARMVRRLATDADTVLIAFALKPDGRDRILFRIDKILKGNMPASGRVSYRWHPGVAVTCLASVAFLNVNPREGQSYILYAENRQLLRAGNVVRYGLDISLQEEIERGTEGHDL